MKGLPVISKCLFCTADGEVVLEGTVLGELVQARVRCVNIACGAQGPTATALKTQPLEARIVAVKRWNREV